MAVIAHGTVNPDTAYGQQFRHGGQILVLPFSIASDALATWQAPPGMNPLAVAWQSDTSADLVMVRMSATTKIVSFISDGLATYTGNLILICGGRS